MWLGEFVGVAKLDYREGDLLVVKRQSLADPFHSPLLRMHTAPAGAETEARCLNKNVLAGCRRIVNPVVCHAEGQGTFKIAYHNNNKRRFESGKSAAPSLPASVRTRVMPIVRPTAEAAVAASHTHRYAVIATEATVRSDAFPRALCAADPAATVRSLAMPALVTLCEQSCTDPSEPRVRHALAPLVRLLDTYPADTLVLGCTHFSAFSEALTALLPPITLIASDRCGARAFAASLSEEQRRGHGITAEIM